MFQSGAGAFEILVGDRRRAARQRVGVGDLRYRQPDPAGRQVELGEERRRQRQRVDGRADVVAHLGELRVGRGPGTAQGGLGLRTCTASPARAHVTAAESPLGPLPTTVTSIPQFKPITLSA
jgi:hypothetical protein